MIFFFDLDGPILDVSEKYYQAYVKSVKKLGGKILDKDAYWNLKRSKTSDYDILSMTSSGRIIKDFKVVHNHIIEKNELLDLDYVWPELRHTYTKLFDKIPTVLVTLRTSSEKTSWQLKNLGIYQWFYSILSHPASDNPYERWRTKVDLINKSGILENIDSKNCVFVGDTETDILAGKQLNMKTICVSFGIRTKDIIMSLNPDLIFDTPFELSTYLQKEYL